MMNPTPEHSPPESQEPGHSSEPQLKLTVRGHPFVDGAYRVGVDDELRMKLLVTSKVVDPERLTIRLRKENEEWQLCKPLAVRTAMLSGERSILFTVELPKATPNNLSQELLDEIKEAEENGLLSPEDAAELRAYRNTLATDLAQVFTTAVPGRYTVQAVYDMEPEPLESDLVALNVISLEYGPGGSKANRQSSRPTSEGDRKLLDIPLRELLHAVISTAMRWAFGRSR